MSNPLDCAKTQWLREFLETYLHLVEHLTPDTPSWQAKAHTFADQLQKTLTDRGLTDPNQQKNHRSQVANALRVCHPHHPAIPYPYTLLESETYTQLNLEQTLKTEQRLTKFFSSDTASALVEKAESLLNSDNPNDLAASLALLVGRRISEILISEFEPCTTYSLWFSYPVKKGNLTELCDPLEIPTLIEAETVLEAMTTLRERWKIEDLRESVTDPIQLKKAINKRYEDVPKAVRRHFSDLIPAREGDGQDGKKLYTHIFRSVYAEIATYFYKPALIPEHQFKAEIQGHFTVSQAGKVRSYTARPHYDDYKISDRFPSTDGIKLGSPDVSVLRVFDHAVEKDKGVKPTSSLSETPSQVSFLEHFCESDDLNLSNLTSLVSEQYQLALSTHEAKYQAVIESKDALIATLQAAIAQSDQHFQQLLSLSSLSPSVSPSPSSSHIEAENQSLHSKIKQLELQLEQVRQERDTAVSKLSQLTQILNPSSDGVKTNQSSETGKKDEAEKGNVIERVERRKDNERDVKESQVKNGSNKQLERQELIDRAIDSIKGYNNDPARPKSEKWYISNSSVADLIRSSGRTVSATAVQTRLRERHLDLTQHHQHHNLGNRQNVRHPSPISQFISLT